MNRREFIGATAAAGAGILIGAPRRVPDKVNVGMIGTANQAGWNLSQLASIPSVNIVALCDVDDNYLGAAANRFPEAKTYNDFRKLIEAKGIDAVLVGTPDHCHAPATLMALEAGLHVYCEKPLTHTVAEARKVADLTKKHSRVTQMGTQIHAGGNYRRVVELVQSGAIGTIKEVHVWCGRQQTAHGRPTEHPRVPPDLHWDLWLGPAPERPFNPAYVPFHWRWWWDFGGGTLADMGCHHMDLSFWALDLRHPTSIEAEGPPVDSENTPIWLTVRYQHPARGDKPPVALTWYHGDKKPPLLPEDKRSSYGDGTLFVGEKGILVADYNKHQLLPEKDFAGFARPPKTIPDSIGHHNEWIEAIKTGGKTTCNFDYSGALTEAVLLGNVSYRLGRKLEWDAKRLKATNCPEADALIKPHYQNGWKF